MKKINFYPGPPILPEEMFNEIEKNLVEYKDTGLSLIETSHRSKAYDEVHFEAISLLKDYLGVPDNYKILLIGGGGSIQFSMVPLNLLPEEGYAQYTLTGSWAQKAARDAGKVGKVSFAFDGFPYQFRKIPKASEMEVDPKAAYFHITANETINGGQWRDFPDTGEVPLVADMSSELGSRRIPVDKFGLIYAGAHKSFSFAGVTIVIIREDLLEKCPRKLTSFLSYKTHADKDSLYHTPPVMAIWGMMLTLRKFMKEGGIDAMEKHTLWKSSEVYRAIDESDGFFVCPVEKDSRSDMNVVFGCADPKLESVFCAEANKAGLIGLPGHSEVGRLRATIYTNMTREGVDRLTEFMGDFARKHG